MNDDNLHDDFYDSSPENLEDLASRVDALETRLDALNSSVRVLEWSVRVGEWIVFGVIGWVVVSWLWP